MSKTSKWTIILVVLLVSNIFTAGKSYHMGHISQLDTNDMLEICSARFFEAVKNIQDQKVVKAKK